MALSFDDHVRRALDSLPPELARGLENVAVVVEDENPDDPDLFGLFQEDPYMPAKISIYRLPLRGRRFPTRTSWRTRFASRCCTSSPTTSGSTRNGSRSWATTDDDVPRRRRDHRGCRRARPSWSGTSSAARPLRTDSRAAA